MRNYDNYSTDIFETTLEEVQDLKMPFAYDQRCQEKNLEIMNRHLMFSPFGKIDEMTLRQIPKHMKRGRGDSATLLIFRAGNRYFGKRYTNNQYFVLEKVYTEEGNRNEKH